MENCKSVLAQRHGKTQAHTHTHTLTHRGFHNSTADRPTETRLCTNRPVNGYDDEMLPFLAASKPSGSQPGHGPGWAGMGHGTSIRSRAGRLDEGGEENGHHGWDTHIASGVETQGPCRPCSGVGCMPRGCWVLGVFWVCCCCCSGLDERCNLLFQFSRFLSQGRGPWQLLDSPTPCRTGGRKCAYHVAEEEGSV